MAKIEVIVPVYNEAENIEPFYDALNQVTKKIKHKVTLTFVDDGSVDDTVDEIKNIKDKNVKIIEFVRNFGKEVATTAGLHKAKADAVILIDGDLQHPIELLSDFIAKWEEGAEVVVGVRKSAANKNPLRILLTNTFYKTLNRVAETNLIPNATDYQLLDKKVVKEFKSFTERGRITRGLIGWLGFKTEEIHFDVKERRHGSAQYSPFKLARLAINSFVSLSLFPLRIAGYAGLAISTLAGLLGTYMAYNIFVLDNMANFTGTAVLATLIVFLIGIVLSSLGLIALYIGAIHREVVNRPLYILKEDR